MRTHRMIVALLTVVAGLLVASPSQAFLVRGTGDGALRGGDLTDQDNVHNEGAYDGTPFSGGFDAQFFASSEPGFGGGEFAFNVFDNLTGGGANKWCCGEPNGFPEIVGARFDNTLLDPDHGIVLTAFTLTSSNDTPTRDPQVWRIEGSNDTTTGLDGTWATIFDHATAVSDWGATRNQVIQYSPADGDAFSNAPYRSFRLVVDQTGATSGAFFAISEVELYGNIVITTPEPVTASLALLSVGGLGLATRRRRRA
jgi:hypothetical protein